MIEKSSTFPLSACVAAVFIAWAVAGVSVAAHAAAPVRQDLTGRWQLNRDLSDDAQEKLQSLGSGGGHAGRGGRRGDHGPGRHGQGSVRGEEKQLEEARNLILNAPTRFVLTQDDQKVVLTEPDGHVRTLRTKNRRVKVDGRDVRTKWENNRLVVETTLANVKVIEMYERSSNARQLIVTAGMDVHGRQVSVRRVYEAVTE